jgi:hypothetical protein
MMNGDLVRERTEPNPFLNAAATIAMGSSSNEKAVAAAYLAVLTRYPTAEESEHFVQRLGQSQGDGRGERMQDLFWTLLNCTEFSWNH